MKTDYWKGDQSNISIYRIVWVFFFSFLYADIFYNG